MPTVTKSRSTNQRRVVLRDQSNTEFVERDRFFDLLVSRRKLFRFDDCDAGVNGLQDPETGKRFYIEAEKLLRLGS